MNGGLELISSQTTTLCLLPVVQASDHSTVRQLPVELQRIAFSYFNSPQLKILGQISKSCRAFILDFNYYSTLLDEIKELVNPLHTQTLYQEALKKKSDQPHLSAQEKWIILVKDQKKRIEYLRETVDNEAFFRKLVDNLSPSSQFIIIERWIKDYNLIKFCSYEIEDLEIRFEAQKMMNQVKNNPSFNMTESAKNLRALMASKYLSQAAILLNNNNLVEIPPEIIHLTKLTDIVFHDTPISYLPPEIGKLTALEDLDISDNCLTYFPTEIGQLSKLQTLCAYNNHLTSIPSELGNLSNLCVVSLSYNQLTDFPIKTGQFSALKAINLANNYLTQKPKGIDSLILLKELNLSNNLFNLSVN